MYGEVALPDFLCVFLRQPACGAPEVCGGEFLTPLLKPVLQYSNTSIHEGITDIPHSLAQAAPPTSGYTHALATRDFGSRAMEKA
jgi:hypothetical protein